MKIDRIRQISTKLGDKGSSKNYSNRAFKKNDILFEVLGTIDELSSFLGLTYHYSNYENIMVIQKYLQNINSVIATDPDSENYSKITKITVNDVIWIETMLQNMLDIKPLEPRFTLPGSEKSLVGAYFDFSRTIARRAERRLVEFSDKYARTDLDLVKSFMNRLSDFLYVLSCNM